MEDTYEKISEGDEKSSNIEDTTLYEPQSNLCISVRTDSVLNLVIKKSNQSTNPTNKLTAATLSNEKNVSDIVNGEKNQLQNILPPNPRTNEEKNPRHKYRPEERPKSAGSACSYSYSYSYSEDDPEEKSEKPLTKSKKIEKQYIPKYLLIQKNQQAQKPIIPDHILKMYQQKALNFQPIEGLDDFMYSGILCSLIEARNFQASNENLKESEKLSRAIDYVAKCQLEQKKYNLQQCSYAKTVEQIDNVKSEIQNFDKETNQQITNLKQKYKEQLARLNEKHERELDIIQAQWNSDAKMRQYNHASPRLIFLRKQYKQFMVQCRFKEAEESKIQIDKLEAVELEQRMEAIRSNFDDAVAKAENRQHEEIQFYCTKSEIAIRQLSQTRNKLKEMLVCKKQKLEKSFEIISDIDKLWQNHQSKRGKNDSSLNSKKTEAALSKLTSCNFKNNDDTTLSLPPLQLRRTARLSIRTASNK